MNHKPLSLCILFTLVIFSTLSVPFTGFEMVFAQGNTANGTQSQNETGNKAAQSGGGNQPNQGIKVDHDFPIEINTGETGDNNP